MYEELVQLKYICIYEGSSISSQNSGLSHWVEDGFIIIFQYNPLHFNVLAHFSLKQFMLLKQKD